MILSSLYVKDLPGKTGRGIIGISCGAQEVEKEPRALLGGRSSKDDFERLVQSVTVGFVAWFL